VDNSNEKLIIKLRGIADNLPKIVDQAGSMLVRNIRSQARSSFKTAHAYPFEFKNDFQKPETVYYKSSEKTVTVDHLAAKRLEYGFGEITITPKNGEYLHFIGRDGEDVYTDKVTIKATKPVGYVRAAIKETNSDLAKKFREVLDA
jgi:hypothetical protein